MIEKMTGSYQFGTIPVELIKAEGKLVLKLGIDVHLLPINETTFYDADNPEVEFAFSDEQDGKFTRITATLQSSSDVILASITLLIAVLHKKVKKFTRFKAVLERL